MKALNWMNSAKTKSFRRILRLAPVALLTLSLTGCSIGSIPERIAGSIVREIIARDYYLWYGNQDEEEEIMASQETGSEDPSDEVPEDNEPSDAVKEEEDDLGEEPEDTEEDEDSGEYVDTDEEDEEETSEDTSVSGNETTADDFTEDEESLSKDKNAYYFSGMNSTEKRLYLEIYNSVIEMKDKITLSSADPDEVDRIFNLCMMDHPEIFYCDGYKSTVTSVEEKPVSIEFEGKFNVDREQRKNKEIRIKKAAEKALSGVPKDNSDYEKAKYVFEWIINNTEYDINAPDNQNISSVFLNKKSVCQGYTYAYKYLLNKLGIFCTIVYGEAAGASHAWNLAKLDGTYCFIDVTWGDSSYRDKNDKAANRTSYNYFGCNKDILIRTHNINNKADIPECTSLDEYYYVKEAKYFTKVDLDRLKAVFDHEAEKGEHMFTIRASSLDVYNDLMNVLFTQKEIFNLVDHAESITYIEDKDELTLTFTV